MKRVLKIGGPALVAALSLLACTGMGRSDFEVWVTDQAGTAGTLYIYDGEQLVDSPSAVTPEVVDLTGAVSSLCSQQTASAPTRAHMLLFNASNTHAILSYVATGHVVFMEASTRTPLACIDVGEQAHQAFPAPDEKYVVVADQNGKKLHRINTNYSTNAFELDNAATLDLAACTTPNGAPCQDPALRPDNAPICSVIDSSSRLAFVTLRGGGLFVVDGTTTPMTIIAEYDKASVRPTSFGCGGMETGGKMFINSGGGTKGNPTGSHLYSFTLSGFQATTGFNPPNTPAPTAVFSKDGGDHDSHMMLFTGGHDGDEGFIWVEDRFANEIEVVEPATDTLVATFSLVGEAAPDPAPDIMDIAPNADYAFVALRGACPLTGNVEGVNNAVGALPGIAVVKVLDGGAKGELKGIAPMTNSAPAGFDCPSRSDDATGSITNQADPHGLRVRLK